MQLYGSQLNRDAAQESGGVDSPPSDSSMTVEEWDMVLGCRSPKATQDKRDHVGDTESGEGVTGSLREVSNYDSAEMELWKREAEQWKVSHACN